MEEQTKTKPKRRNPEDPINVVDVAALKEGHDLVRQAMLLVKQAKEIAMQCAGKDHRSEVLAAKNGLVMTEKGFAQADQYFGEAIRNAGKEAAGE